MKKLILIWKFESVTQCCHDLTSALGIRPHEIWNAGEKVGKSLIVRDKNGIQISEEFGEFNDIDESLVSFVEKYSVSVSRMLKANPDISGLLRIVVYSEGREGLYLNRKLLGDLAQTGSDVDFDPYQL